MTRAQLGRLTFLTAFGIVLASGGSALAQSPSNEVLQLRIERLEKQNRDLAEALKKLLL